MAKRAQFTWDYSATPTNRTTSWKNGVSLDMFLDMYLYTKQLWQGEKKKVQCNSKATAVYLTTIYSHSSSEFFQPSTPDHMNTQKKKYRPTAWGYRVLICSKLAKSLPVFILPKLMGEIMQKKIWGTGNWEEGNILLLSSWLATWRKIKSSVEMTSYQLLGVVEWAARL